MNSADPWSGLKSSGGLLIDTNLLVLFVVGGVNRARIGNFKRTRQYDIDAYELLCRVVARFKPLYTVAHVMAEVSDLTDLTGLERLKARYLLKEMLVTLREPAIPSIRAVQNAWYENLGLVDAAIATLARECRCTVITDDLDLYRALAHDGLPVLNFSHLRKRAWGL